MPACLRWSSVSVAGSTVVSGGKRQLAFDAVEGEAEYRRGREYGLADGSMTFTSTFAPCGLLGPPIRNRTAASRFSVPQHTYAPDQ